MAKKSIVTFGEYLKRLRESLGYPQRKIAAQLDIDPSLLGKYERNERTPSREHIKKLAVIFGEDENRLFEEVLSDQIANKIIAEKGNMNVLKVAQEKIIYFKKKDECLR